MDLSKISISIVAGALLLLASANARADTVVLPATRDVTLIEKSAGDLASGAGPHLCVGNSNQGPDENTRRAVIAFDVAGQIPAGATIESVSLTLWMGQTQAGPTSIALRRSLAGWSEGASSENGCDGTTATAGDATWRYTDYDPNAPPTSPAWASPGGDFSGTIGATTVVDQNGYYTWSSLAMAADVQAWLDLPATNHGWFLIGNESTTSTAKRFDSQESNQAARRPTLTVAFTPAAPAGACCLPNGECQLATSGECTLLGGTYQGDGVPCTPNPCVVATGACCLPSGLCAELSAADCTAQGGTYQGDGTACAPDLCPVVLTPYLDPLPIPAVAQPLTGTPGGAATYEIAMTQFTQTLHAQLPPTVVWGFGGSYPGPTIEAASGVPITVTWQNELRDSLGLLRTDHYLPVDLCLHGPNMHGSTPRTIVHLHGGHVPAAVDGYPESTILPGESVVYEYPNDQGAATLWYHDHAFGITRLNVYMGLAGFYIVRDPAESALDMPAGAYEIPLVIQDRSFHPDGSLEYPATWQEHFFGDKILVNGKVWPYLAVDRGLYRFRVLNGSNSRTYRLTLSNGAPFAQIGSDGGLLPAPVSRSVLLISPGERMDVVIDFSALAPGTEVLLGNDAPAPYPGGTGIGGVVPEVMKFVVGSAVGHTTPLPAVLTPIETLHESDAIVTRDFELRKFAEPCAGSQWLINGLHWDDITEQPVLGTTEVWRFVNRSGLDHPMHMHLVFFQLLDRQPFEVVGSDIVPIGPPVPPPPEEQGWKDTVPARPYEITRVIARFEDYEGLYAYHCHTLEHEDHEMMRQFRTVAPPRFIRGDGNQDGSFDISDPVMALLVLFAGGFVDCPLALDANDDDAVDIADPISMLATLFQSGPVPPPPHPDCGADPTSSLDCTSFAACP